MKHSPLDRLVPLDGVNMHAGVEHALLNRLVGSGGVKLPTDHQEALLGSNGIEVFGGYFRLFGVGEVSANDMTAWNREDAWKFAWSGRCADYWCFGETAWGDQYAYRISDLGSGNATVYFLDCLAMTPTAIASDFTEFLQNEFVRCAQSPYDEMVVEARHTLGNLGIEEHLIYLPSPLLGGTEEIANVQKMNARSAMICNGDIAIQLDAGPPGGNVIGVALYEDAEHRARLRLTWA